MIRLKELLTQLVEKRAARMAEAGAKPSMSQDDAEARRGEAEQSAAAAAKVAGLQADKGTELVTTRVPAETDAENDLRKQGFRDPIAVFGKSVTKAIEKDKRSSDQQSDSSSTLARAYKARQDRLKNRQVFGGVRANVKDLPPELQGLAKAADARYNRDITTAKDEFDAWEKERKDSRDKEQAVKAAAQLANVKQRGDKYMNIPAVGNVELPQDNDAVDLSTLDQTALDTVKKGYQNYMSFKPSSAEASNYMRLLLAKYKLPPDTNPLKATPAKGVSAASKKTGNK